MPFGRPRTSYQKLRNLASLASESYQDLVNVFFSRHPDSLDNSRTYPKKTLGYAQQGTNAGVTTSRGLALGSYQPSTGTAGLYAAWGVYVYLIGSGAPTKQNSDAKHELTTNTDGEFEQVNDDLLYTNGIGGAAKDNVLKLSAGTWTEAGAGGTPANATPLTGANVVAKYLSFHNFMLFAARTVTNPNKLFVSEAGNPYNFPTAQTKTFPYKIVGMKPLGEYLVIYTEKTIHSVTGLVPTALGFREIPHAHPCVSHRSIVKTVRQDAAYSSTGAASGVLEHWYLGNDYVWAFNGSTFRILGKDSWDNYRAQLSTSYLNTAAATLDTVTGQYWLSVPTGTNTVPNVTWAYDPTADKWVEKPFYKAAAWAHHGVPTPDLYFVDSQANGKAYKANSGQSVVSPTTGLRGDHTASATTILVDSTADFPTTTGTLMIENESIHYGDIDQPGTPTALTATDSAVAGNLNGAYLYKVTFVTSTGETAGGTASGSVNVVNKKMSLTAIPTGGEGTTARKIYRTIGGGAAYLLLTTISNNTETTYTDNTADGSLGAAIPASDTANAFLICTRGYSGTAAAAHLDDVAVYLAHVFTYRTRHLDFEEPDLFKKFQVLWVNAKISSTQMGLYLKTNIDHQGFNSIGTIDLQSSGTTWGSFTWGASNWGAPEILMTPDNRKPVSGRGKTIKIAAEEAASIQQTEVYEMDLKLRPLKIK